MPRARSLQPRKAPTQERSREMVERILDAGTRVLVAHGYAGASTNRIAQEAGISPGSLYQYYPNKDAIVIAVVERYGQQMAANIAGRLTAMLDAPPDVLVGEILGALVDALSEQPEMLRAIVENVPRNAGGDQIGAFEQRIGDLTRGYLMMHRDLLREADLEAAIWILVQLVEQLTIRYVLDAPPIPREHFVDELTRLAIGYLAAPQAVQAAQAARRARSPSGPR